MKLVAIMGNKSIDIYRKKLNNDYEPKNSLIRINYEQSVNYEIIRHSNTLLVLKAKSTPANPSDNLDKEDGEAALGKNEVHLTLESSYQRDVFALLLKRMNEHYLKEISRVDLTEVDFYKRRESYLERQLQQHIIAGKEKEQNNAKEIKLLKQMVSEKEDEIEQMKMPTYEQEMQAMAIEDALSRVQMAQVKYAKLEE